MLRPLVLLLVLALSGCTSVVLRPAADDVHSVALVSVYMNREFYNTRSPLAAEGESATVSLVEAASRSAFEALLGREARSEPAELYDPERTRIISFAVHRYRDQLDALSEWRMLPTERVVRSGYYRRLVRPDAGTGMAARLVSAYLNHRESIEWVTPPGYHRIPIESVIDGERIREDGARAMSKLARELDVDAVAILELDMAYRYNRFAKISFFGTTFAVPTVSHSLVVVNRRGEVAVNTGAIVRGGGERFEGDTVGMVKDDALVLNHSTDEAVHSYNLAIAEAAEALREVLEDELGRR